MNEPPILEYARSTPNSRLRSASAYMLGIVGSVYIILGLFSIGPINFGHWEDLAFATYALVMGITFIVAGIHVIDGSRRWALAACILVIVNICLILAGLGWAIFDVVWSTNRFAPLNFQMRVCFLVPVGASLVILVFMLRAVMRQLHCVNGQTTA